MKKLIISTLSAIMLMPMAATAQDDMYFVPTKDNVKKASQKYGMPKDTYYCGSNRDVDEYNRRLRSTVEVIDGDTIATDIISFDPVNGEYPDTLATMQQEDYKCTRSMSRWDDYEVSNAYWHGYTDGRFNRWYGWSTFYDPWYYGGWYGGWYDPWYAGWHSYYGWGGWHGWYDPWYYGWGGYYPYYPVYVGGGGHYGERDRFIANRFDRTNNSFDRANSRTVGRNIANRDRSYNISDNSSRLSSMRTRLNTSDNSQRYNNMRSSESRQNSFNNNSYTRGNGSSSFNSGSSRSFGGGSGSMRNSGAGVRMGGGRR